MSMAHSQEEIKGKSLVKLAEELEASIREAAQKGKGVGRKAPGKTGME